MVSVVAEHAWVEFPISSRSADKETLATIGGSINAEENVVAALQDVSLELREGDRLGIVGHNGAGKTTMLRLLAGVYSPTRGRVAAVGRISTLFNSTPGINLDGTGRENILICGLHLGLSRQEVRAKADDIINFAELGPYIDLPVRTYSSGMLMRLGFAIATSVDPEILILDEGLATGDASFTQKAQAKMNDLIDRSSILILASHSESFVQSVCNRCIVLEHGRILGDGEPGQLVENYRNHVIEGARSGGADDLKRAYLMAIEMANKGETPPLELEELGLRYALGVAPDSLEMLNRYKKVMELQGKQAPLDLEISILVRRGEVSGNAATVRDDLEQMLAQIGEERVEADLIERAHKLLKTG
ncbi:MAG: ABC transporter ATP-binding protein [Alphaproteobacteria bacterium]|nr:ABC transporter ATP-binding protein [Alphaproteobacteria bacterium]